MLLNVYSVIWAEVDSLKEPSGLVWNNQEMGILIEQNFLNVKLESSCFF